jgi:hypothetical protein
MPRDQCSPAWLQCFYLAHPSFHPVWAACMPSYSRRFGLEHLREKGNQPGAARARQPHSGSCSGPPPGESHAYRSAKGAVWEVHAPTAMWSLLPACTDRSIAVSERTKASLGRGSAGLLLCVRHLFAFACTPSAVWLHKHTPFFLRVGGVSTGGHFRVRKGCRHFHIKGFASLPQTRSQMCETN